MGRGSRRALMTTRWGLRLICADSWLVAVHKPSGVPSVPARNPLDPPSVAEQLRASHGPLEAVHRLDRDTSGVLLLARHREARVRLGRSFEQGLAEKRYLAICHGRPPKDEGDLHLPLAADLSRPPCQRVDPIHGRRAQTRWRLLATDESRDEHRSLLELEPRTGRSHQLRVHMAWLGTPVVGDRLPAAACSACRLSGDSPSPRRRADLVSGSGRQPACVSAACDGTRPVDVASGSSAARLHGRFPHL